MGIIYKATNKINGKFYIGQTNCSFDKRKREHITDARLKRDRCRLFHKAIRKHGKENFKWEIILESDNRGKIDSQEEILIRKLKPAYNLSKGAGGSYIRTKEERELRSRIAIEQYKNGRIPSNLGRKFSKEWRERISKNHADVSGKNNPRYGDHRSYEELHGKEKANLIKIKISEKAKELSKNRSRDKFGRFIKEERNNI